MDDLDSDDEMNDSAMTVAKPCVLIRMSKKIEWFHVVGILILRSVASLQWRAPKTTMQINTVEPLY